MPLWLAVLCHWPPRSSLASNTVTSNPASIACLAAVRPPGPAPTTATRAPLPIPPIGHRSPDQPARTCSSAPYVHAASGREPPHGYLTKVSYVFEPGSAGTPVQSHRHAASRRLAGGVPVPR